MFPEARYWEKTYKSALKSHTFKGYKGRQIKERVEL